MNLLRFGLASSLLFGAYLAASVQATRLTPQQMAAARYELFWNAVNKDDPAFVSRAIGTKQAYEEQKASGWHPAWLDPATLKSRADYEKMPSAELATDAFSTGLFAKLSTMQSTDPRNGIVMMGVFHDGYAVLQERPDYWLGIASLYRSQSEKLVKAKTDNDRMDAIFTLQSIKSLYTFPLYRERLKGREAAVLESQLVALRVFRDYALVASQGPASQFSWAATTSDGLVFPTLAMAQRVAPSPPDFHDVFEKLPTTNPATPAQAAAYLDAVIRAGETALASAAKLKAASASPNRSANSPNASANPSPVGPTQPPSAR